MKECLTTMLLGGGVALTSVGIHEHNIICAVIAGFMLGVYNALIQNK
jgi:hypothetical protein